MAKNIKPRKDDYAQWYIDVIKAAQMADYSPVRGCMVIRPEGFAIWEAIQRDIGTASADRAPLVPMANGDVAGSTRSVVVNGSFGHG